MSITTPTAVSNTISGRRASPATYSLKRRDEQSESVGGRRQFRGQPCGERLEVRLRLREAHAWPEARDDVQVVRAAPQLLRG